LHIVTFVLDNVELAEKRAKVAKRYIVKNFPDFSPERIRVSWFGQAESFDLNDTVYNLNASLNIFTAKTGGKGR
jgi:flagellar motor protein MotB